MAKPEFSAHSREMLVEREIPEEWVWRAIRSSDDSTVGPDGNVHYIKAIDEHEGRVLRVIVNESVKPHRIVTVFFDRRLRRRH